jgi:hypothetical protein
MKLNFWQWLGIIVFVLGAIGYFIYKGEHPSPTPQPAAPPPTAPATTPLR